MYALMMLFVLGCAAAAGMFSLSIVAKLFPALEHGTPLPGAIHMAFAVVGLALVLYSKSKEITAAGQPLAGKLRDWGLGVLGYLTIAVVVLNGTGARVNGAVGGLGARPFVALFACAIALGAHLINARKMLQVRQKAALDVPMSAAAVAPVVAPVAPKVIATKPTKAFADIGGMKDLKATLARALAPYRAYNGRDAEICDQNGLLLSGPPGNGKTMIAEAIAGELGFNFINATVGDVTSKWVNQSSEELEAVVNAAIAAQPCVLFFDEFDAIARSRDGASARSAHAEDLKLVNSLLTQIDRIRKHRVLLIAATNFPDAIDPAIVRDGRFDHRIEVPYPDFAARLAILNDVAKRYQVNVPEAVANQASRRWEQRSAAFIDGVLKRVRDDLRATGKRTADLVDLKAADRAASRFESALPTKGDKLTQMHLPEATMMEAKSLLGRLRHWDETIEQGGTPPRGVLLYGPPGTGKTNLIRAVARELGDWHLFVVNAAEILADPRSFKDVLHKASPHVLGQRRCHERDFDGHGRHGEYRSRGGLRRSDQQRRSDRCRSQAWWTLRRKDLHGPLRRLGPRRTDRTRVRASPDFHEGPRRDRRGDRREHRRSRTGRRRRHSEQGDQLHVHRREPARDDDGRRAPRREAVDSRLTLLRQTGAATPPANAVSRGEGSRPGSAPRRRNRRGPRRSGPGS